MPPFKNGHRNTAHRAQLATYKSLSTDAPAYAEAPRPSVKPSAYQQAIIDWLLTGEGNAIVNAKAGSGKTSTLCMLSDLIPVQGTRAAFLAFNKSIQEELERRLPRHVTAATFHSVMRAALLRMPQFAAYGSRRNWINKSKAHAIFDTMLDSYMDAEKYRRGVVQLVSLMKANVLLPDVSSVDLLDLVNRYDIEFDESAADGGLQQGCDMARALLTTNNAQLDCVDFDDLLYFAAIMNAPVMRYSHLFVDEAQDTNKVQRVLIARMLAPNARAIFVGDPSQSIYGFRGADSEAMNAITEQFNCQTFPLSISYRCPASVIRLAQTLEPDILPRDNAPEGTVTYADSWNATDFNALDLVLCRNTAPLVALAFRFLRAHMPVKIMGREIGEQLITLIQKMRAATTDELADKIDEYTNREVTKALAKRQESKAERLNDQRDAIIAICEGLPEDARTVYEVISVIRRLFTDEGAGKQTTLSTIHKAKGREAYRVFILDSFLMPSRYAKQAWQMKQEHNLMYVSYTRALDTLVFVDSKAVKW